MIWTLLLRDRANAQSCLVLQVSRIIPGLLRLILSLAFASYRAFARYFFFRFIQILPGEFTPRDGYIYSHFPINYLKYINSEVVYLYVRYTIKQTNRFVQSSVKLCTLDVHDKRSALYFSRRGSIPKERLAHEFRQWNTKTALLCLFACNLGDTDVNNSYLLIRGLAAAGLL